MPLSEFLRLAIEKLESSKQKSQSTDLSSRTENDLVELAPENGQIVMQEQSNRVTRSPTHHTLSLNTPRARDAALGNSTTLSIEKSGEVEYIFNDISPVAPSVQLDLSQNDKTVSWLSCPVDDGPQDYCSEFLPEISNVTTKRMLARNSFVTGDKGSCSDQAVSNLDNGHNAFKFPPSRARPLCSLPSQQGQTTDSSLLSGVSSIFTNNTSNCKNSIFGNCSRGGDVESDSSAMKMENQNIELPSNNSSLLNFSHFSRPETLVKANLPLSGRISSSVSSGIKKMGVKDKGLASRWSNPVKSVLIERLNSTPTDMDFCVPFAPTDVNSRQLPVKEPKESFLDERTENFCQDTIVKTVNALTQSDTPNSTVTLDGDRNIEPMVASSAVGSGNIADRVSCKQTHNSKRNFCDIESECHSDDIQTESGGVEKSTPARRGTGSKRSRVAEVHNLSERRRRDRINEKMRALQELIPSCNQTDKASMLDEAITYLKYLQLQVQIMNVRAQLYIPQMMFHPGTPHMYPAPIPHFSPIGDGMGMSMSFGNINCGSPQCPVLPLPSIQGAHIPFSALGLTNLQGICGSNLPIHGHPSPRLQSIVPRAPLVPLTGRHKTSAMDSSALRESSRNEMPSTSSNLNSGDPMTNKNSQRLHNAEASSSTNLTSNQLQATNEVPNQSSVVHKNDQAATALTSTTTTEIRKEAD